MEAKAHAVLDARAQFMTVGDDVRSLTSKPKSQSLVTSTPTKTATLADLYDPLAMPPALAKAHAELDRAVDLCYRPEKFDSDRQRVEFLFALYEKITAPLIAAAKSKRPRRKPAFYADKPPAPPAPQHPGPNPDQAAADAAHYYGIGKEDSPPYFTAK